MEKCPEAHTSYYGDVSICNLNGKVCLLEGDNECPYYEEFLAEMKESNEEQ